ncbi:MAG: sugar-binding transcriptional regulator [Anaerolineae bacterium]|nr:sugar-binding transcriptional regulator [Anaerolineae bacterium]
MELPDADGPRQTLIEVSRLYYEMEMTQTDIGRRLSLSRSTVSRMLQRARDTGIVTITVNYEVLRDHALEDAMKSAFALREARVLRSRGRSFDSIRNGLGKLGASLLDESLDDNSTLGISYGRSLANTVELVRPRQVDGLTVVPIIGALGSENPLIEGIDLTRQLATKLGARYRYLHAPLLVEDRRTRDLFLQEPTVNDVIQIAANADVVLIGIGSLQAQSSGIIWTGYITRKERDWLDNIGVVGHMCAQFFDVEGKVLDIGINQRSISIGLEALRRIDNVIAVAGTIDKAGAILGALNGGYIDSLVTDDRAARQVLELRNL